MTAAIDKAQALELERRFWDAMRIKDANTAADLTADNCIVVGAQGVSSIDPKMMSKLTTEGQWSLRKYDFDEASVQVSTLGPGTMTIAYKVSEDLVVDGKELTLEANDASVWVEEGGRWKCALHTESPIGDAFGRDRIPSK